MSNWFHEERRLLQVSAHDLKLQRDIYLQEVKMDYTTLFEISASLSAFRLFGSLVDQVKLLAREVVKKDKFVPLVQASLSATKTSLSTSQDDLENQRIKNISLAQELDKATDTDLAYISNSFENALFQVEHFYLPLCIFREKVVLDQLIEDEKNVLLSD